MLHNIAKIGTPVSKSATTFLFKYLMVSLLLFSLSSTLVHAQSDDIAYSNVNQNPAFSVVSELASKNSDRTLIYAKENDLQFAKFWRAKSQNHEDEKGLVAFIHGGCWLDAFDFRAPNILRLGFSPLFLSFKECLDAMRLLNDVIHNQTYLEPKYQVRNQVT